MKDIEIRFELVRLDGNDRLDVVAVLQTFSKEYKLDIQNGELKAFVFSLQDMEYMKGILASLREKYTIEIVDSAEGFELTLSKRGSENV